MPIPRQTQNEFFIPNINILYFEENDNQAVIYESIDNIPLFSDFITPYFYFINYSFDASDWIVFDFDSTVKNNFISDMMDIYLKINSSSTLDDSYSFRNYLDEFMVDQEIKEITLLTYNFYIKISNDSNIQNLFGSKLVEDLQNNVLIYYKKLNQDKYKKKLYKQFKEFKVYQRYSMKKFNYQLKMKIRVRNHFVYQYRFSKIILLQRVF